MIIRTLIFAAFLTGFSSFAQISFEENIVVDNSYVIQPHQAFFGDIDNDGDQDIMTGGSRTVAWFENTDGMGTYGKRKLIANYPLSNYIASPSLEDIDGDGDLDAIVSMGTNDRTVWFENLDGLGNFGPERIISSVYGSLFVSDIDSDGDMDILASYFHQQKIVWMENLNGSGQLWNLQIIDVDVPDVRSLKTADLDGDGDNDVILTSYYYDQIIWYENLDGNGDFGTQIIISTEQNDPTSVYAADIDNDGDLDVVSTADLSDRVGWHENIDGNGNFAPLQTIATNVEGANALNVADIDNDGDLDVFAAAIDDNYIAFYENLDGQGTFGTAQLISDMVVLPASIQIADVDNDGYLDVMCVSLKNAKLTWYKNTNGQGNFGNQNIIHEDIDNVENLYAADLDGDGDMDIITAANHSSNHGNGIIAWIENTNGHGNFGKHKGIDYPARAIYVRAADVDGDGDMDVIAGTFSSSSRTILWYENLDGLGNFGEVQDISNGLIQLTSLEIADFDGDNDVDILFTTTSYFGWIENVDGLGNFGVVHSLPPVNSGTNTVAYPVDLDNDGDMDILSWRFFQSGEAIWFENIDGMGNFGPLNIIYNIGGGDDIRILTAADMDLDGDMDVVINPSGSGEALMWIENMDGQGNFGNITTITGIESNPRDIYLGDLDNDNDIDIVFAAGTRFGWIENMDGQGNFGPVEILSDNSLEAYSVFMSDLDNDGDIDIMGGSRLDSRIIWFGNSLILSLYENNKLKFSAFPNPTNDLITIQSETSISFIKIYNSLGQLVLSNEHKNTINISSLQSGVYFLNLSDSNGTQGTVQVIKN